MSKIKSLTVQYQSLSGSQLVVKTKEGKSIIVECNKEQVDELTTLSPYLQLGNVFNLLNAVENENGNFITEFLVFEPDYLIDISSLAECFRPYGNHPLNYALSRLQTKDNTSHILLGNAANFFIDELIHESDDSPAEYLSTLKKLFQNSPFEFTTCEDLKDSRNEVEFFKACQKHYQNISNIISNIFPKVAIDKENAVLEPSFICNALGFQGRLDIMLNDFSAFIELKSGKAVEDFRTGGQFIHSCINHYTQMILYLAVLEFNLDLQADDIRSYLLYSKYPVLSKEKHSRSQLQEAIQVRNEIVAMEYRLQNENNISYTQKILSNITSAVLNAKKLSGNFFDNYLSPSIDKFQNKFSLLNEQEKAYFLHLYNFITKELWLSKVGEKEYEGIKKASNLWNAPFEDKIIGGEILYNLKIMDNQAATERHCITLEVPQYEDLYLPNFRQGDAVVLYERNTKEDTVNNRQVFKGSIEALGINETTIRLRYRQRNLSVWNASSYYALEHDYMDSTYIGMFKALTTFLEANQERRDLLLCKRMPEIDNNYIIEDSSKEADDILRAINKATNAKDCFLLVGPPGTGKTSLALKQMVEASLKNTESNILLLSYTNRAVDEICKALESIHQSLPYIRIGSELNCAAKYRNHLLDNCLDNCKRRSEVETVISTCRIFAGTVASVWNKPELFKLKQFDIAIIDEATQLLEPHLLGILCTRTQTGEDAVKRFVLIGDHKQLPAVVLQSKEESSVEDVLLKDVGLTNLSNSLFERLYRKYNTEGVSTAFDILSKQGRMHPVIASFPSQYFYNNQLDCVGLAHQKEEDSQLNRLTFFSIKRSENEHSEKTNWNEARKVVEICQDLYEYSQKESKEFNPESIGIITPYRNQIALVRKLLQETNIKSFSSILVDTIERFQGSQKDIIIYSFCVNTLGQLATLPNIMEENGKIVDRKLNVVLTRARKQLFIIGNDRLLSQNSIYNTLINHIRVTGVIKTEE